MGYLIAQMLLCLLAATLLGFLIGWWLRGSRCHKDLDNLEASWRGRLDSCELEVQKLRSSTGDEDASVALRAELGDAQKALEAAEARVERRSTKIVDLESQLTAAAVAAPGVVSSLAADVDVDPDDLTKVEGIGPKIQELLNEAGIFTFANLANTAVEFIQGVLDKAGDHFQVHDPTTWAQQAQLAADGRWEELERFQEALDGGKIG